MRSTKTSRAVLALLGEASSPMSALDLLAHLQETSPRLHKTTVYRTLKKMQEHEQIVSVRLDSDVAYYELASLPHHHHVKCTACGTIEDLHGSFGICQQIADIEEKTNFQIASHQLDFFGLCQSCVALDA